MAANAEASTSSTFSTSVPDADTMKILIATDIHLGFCENDPIRQNDSFNTFEEILQLAVTRDVDFILLGGDLFHDNKPKASCLQRAMELLQKYCLGNRPVAIEYLSVPQQDFGSSVNNVNYYDPNINISFPVFTIHGNHDDPIGETRISAVDHLVAAKLVNHFGQYSSLNHVTVRPVLLRKGKTHLALYGLGSMRDERLHRLFRHRKVQFYRSDKDSEKQFNLFVMHQNRPNRQGTNHIPASFLPPFMNLVLWGHEHECRIDPEVEDIDGGQLYICQPGSSVATSLAVGEAVEKHVGILHIKERLFKIDKVPLKTVRPFMFQDIDLTDFVNEIAKTVNYYNIPAKVEDYITDRVKRLIDNSAEKLTGHPMQPTVPLIRVRVLHDSDHTFSHNRIFHPSQFYDKFEGQIANEDIITFKRKSVRTEPIYMDMEALQDLVLDPEDNNLEAHVENIVEEYFRSVREKGETKSALEVLSERGLSLALKEFVEKDYTRAIDVVIKNQISDTVNYLVEKGVNEDNFEEELQHFISRRNAVSREQETHQTMQVLKNMRESNEEEFGSFMDDDDVAASDTNGNGNMGPPRGRGRGRGSRGGRASRPRGTRGRGRGRGAAANRSTEEEDDDEDGSSSGASSSWSSAPTTRGTRSRGRGRGRGTSAAAASSSPASSQGSQGRLKQTTLQVRRSTRSKMQFDD